MQLKYFETENENLMIEN